MIDSVHYFSENNNYITFNTILLYIVKRTRLTTKCFVDGIKDVVVNRKSKLNGLKINRFFVSAHGIKHL